MLCAVDVENIANSILSSLPQNTTRDKVLCCFFLEKSLVGISDFNPSSNKRQKNLINLCHISSE